MLKEEEFSDKQEPEIVNCNYNLRYKNFQIQKGFNASNKNVAWFLCLLMKEIKEFEEKELKCQDSASELKKIVCF